MPASAPAKTAPQTAQRLAPAPKHGGARLPLGAHPGNTGGKKGRSGPKPREFKDFLKAEIRDNPARRAELAAAAGDRDSRGFSHAWKIATDYDDAKPAEKHALQGKIEISVKMVREGRRRTVG